MARASFERWSSVRQLVQAPARRGSAQPLSGSPKFAAKMSFLSENRVFASLSSEERVWLATSTTMVECERGRVFYTPGDRSEVIFILKRGLVDLYRIGADGRKLVMARLKAKTIFGEMGLVGQGMYGCFAEAAEDSLICVLSRADMTGLVRRNPDVGLNLLKEISVRLQEREADLEALAFHGVPSRLASFLLTEADSFGTVVGLTHQEIGERLGIYRETVSQALGRFRGDGLITVEPRRIRLLSRDRLAAIAER